MRVRVVDVPDDLGRGPVDPDQVEQGPQVSLGLGGGPPPNGPPGGILGSSGDKSGLSTGKGSRNSSVAPPFLT